MKSSKLIVKLLMLLIATASVAYAQQQFIQTVSKDNKNCNAVCSVIDVPELNGNPSAVIFLTPIGKTADLNPHPVGAYYMYLKKWSVYNLDGVQIPEGAQYAVEYYPNADANHFVYIASQNRGLGALSGTCIDRAVLNRNSSAQVKIFPVSSPTRGAWFNDKDVKAEYNPKSQRWCVRSVDGSGVKLDTAYSIAISTGSPSLIPTPSGAPIGTPVQIDQSLPISTVVPGSPAPQSPLTVVARVQWPLPFYNSINQNGMVLTPGSCLIYDYENPDILVTDFVIATGQLSDAANLKWTGVAINGSVRLNVCNAGTAPSGIQLNGRKVNILVLR